MAEPPTKRATLQDVANHAGVSYQTVSRVINKSAHVSNTTRQRVLEAIASLGYQPNRVAQALVTNRSYTIKMVTFGLSYYGPAQMMLNVEQVAKAQGYELVVTNIKAASEAEIKQVIAYLGQEDGILLIAPIRNALFNMLTEACRHIPMVCIGTHIGSALPSVVFDQHRGEQLATQHLIDRGHSQIAEISGPLYWHDALARHESWLATLTANGLTPAIHLEGDWTAASGYTAALQLLGTRIPFTGLIIGNDQMALGAMRALRERGLRIPDDVSIVGFDNIPEISLF